jgi:hypothetical protein
VLREGLSYIIDIRCADCGAFPYREQFADEHEDD